MKAVVVAYGLTLLVANTFAISILPKTEGFSRLSPTLLCIAGFIVTAWSLARLIGAGLELSVLMPLAAAVIPLAAIGVGVFLYGEAASLPKIGLLVLACGLIGVAAKL